MCAESSETVLAAARAPHSREPLRDERSHEPGLIQVQIVASRVNYGERCPGIVLDSIPCILVTDDVILTSSDEERRLGEGRGRRGLRLHVERIIASESLQRRRVRCG